MSSPLFLALALLAAPAVALAAIAGRRALVMALPFLVAANGIALTLGGSSVRAEQLAACLLVVPLAAGALAGARPLRLDSTARWLGAILAANLVASALHSPARAYSVLQCASLASTWVIYLVLLAYLDTRESLDAFVRRLAWAGIAATGIAVAAFALAVAGAPLGGAEVSRVAAERLTRAYGAYGTMVEPNILGSFAAAHLVLAAGMLGAGIERRLARWLAALSGAALLVSFTRAAWIGAVVGILVLVALGARRLRVRAPLVVAAGLVLLTGAALLALPGEAGALLRFKLANVVNFGSQTGVLRLMTYALALQQTLDHPLIGWGTYTFAPLVAEGIDFRQFENWRNLWIGNWLLLALHDTGVVGLALWVGLVGSTLRRGLRAARALRVLEPALAARTAALTAAVAALLVPFLATTGFSLGYPWLLIGLLGAHCRLAEAPSPAAATASSPAPAPAALPADAT